MVFSNYSFSADLMKKKPNFIIRVSSDWGFQCLKGTIYIQTVI